ncbi:MAG TPA: DUF2721 domain-containing protein, partial [Bryobacteraceae bacterium]|nr:DUF2721 domain-containing protein [Bryobacteraceae bacterium]
MAANDAIQVLTAAVTPVVLVSATAILISGTNSRYISISDRMRALAHEYRDPNCIQQRRITISHELLIFQHRIHLVSWAVRTLYMAVGAFIVDALIISATLWRHMLAAATLPLFLIGILFDVHPNFETRKIGTNCSEREVRMAANRIFKPQFRLSIVERVLKGESVG